MSNMNSTTMTTEQEINFITGLRDLFGPVSSQQHRHYKSHFRGMYGRDCGCGCGSECYAYVAPFTPEERLQAHRNAFNEFIGK